MNAKMELAKESYLDGLPADHANALPGAPNWLNSLRADASRHANALAYPTSRDEDWRFTDLAPLLKHDFSPASATHTLVGLADIGPFIAAEATASRLVFVNGVHAPELSSCKDLHEGVTVSTLSDALTKYGALIQTHFARHARFDQNIFSARNTTHFTDGAVIVIAPDHEVAAPVQLLFITTPHDSPSVSYPRALIVAERGSRCTLVEEYVGLGENVYFTNAVTEIIVAENAHVQHTRLQRESRTAFHIAQCAVTLARESAYISTTVTLGARLSRYNLNVVQTAEATQCTLDGLALISGRQLADTHTFMDHAQPHGSSKQLHKCIVDGAAQAVFNGKIMVRTDAQLTDSRQSSRNLLLSDKAQVNTKPQLEIFADDVKCAHGATVGQLDMEELFYLKSRGLTDLSARNLLTYAFAAEIIDRIPVASVKKQLRQIVLDKTNA